MTVFAWILFVITALSAIGFLYSWFDEGAGLIGFLFAVACVVYLVFYLFIPPVPSLMTWIYFISFCVFTFVALLFRQFPAFVGLGIFVLFFALVLF